MISIETMKIEKATQKLIYKTYRHTNGSISLTMEQIKEDRENNDLSIYTPIEIINIWDDVD